MNAMTILTLLGGLGMFLFGIKAMGDGLELAAGRKMKRLLEILTRNKMLAVLVGVLVTGVIQSSSATTVMVVGFVNAGLLELSKAIGVIMGANIGTTVTSLMLSVKLNFGVIFAAIGGVCML
ncbi:MAG: Na/Pi symporter, partial [Clostridia bacterium]